MKKLIGVVALVLLAIPAFAQVTSVESVQTHQTPCFVWGGGSGSQGQFSTCGNTTVVTVTKTEVREVKVPGPERLVEKIVEKEVPAKRIRE
jgi:hypothetical protein